MARLTKLEKVIVVVLIVTTAVVLAVWCLCAVLGPLVVVVGGT